MLQILCASSGQVFNAQDHGSMQVVEMIARLC